MSRVSASELKMPLLSANARPKEENADVEGQRICRTPPFDETAAPFFPKRGQDFKEYLHCWLHLNYYFTDKTGLMQQKCRLLGTNIELITRCVFEICAANLIE